MAEPIEAATPDPADEQPKPAPSLGERIHALVPDHAYVRSGGPFSGASKWQWTTPAGTWLVEASFPTFPLFDRGVLKFTGGGATIALPATEAGFAALRAVMMALGAIVEEMQKAADGG